MLMRCLSASVASSLHDIPGATSTHSGSAHSGPTGNTGFAPVSAAMRSASRACSEPAGRSTSVGQNAKLSTTGRSASTSRVHCAHEEICASTAETWPEGSARMAYALTCSACWQLVRIRAVSKITRRRSEKLHAVVTIDWSRAVRQNDVYCSKQQRIGQFKDIGHEFGQQPLADAETPGERLIASRYLTGSLQQFYGASAHGLPTAGSARERQARSEKEPLIILRSLRTRSTVAKN